MRRTRIAVLASVMVIAVSAIEARAECNRACLTGSWTPNHVHGLASVGIEHHRFRAGVAEMLVDDVEAVHRAFGTVPERLRQRHGAAVEGDFRIAGERNLPRSVGREGLEVGLKVLDGRITEIETIRANKGDATRFENGLQTTGMARDGVYVSAAAGFDLYFPTMCPMSFSFSVQI